MTRRLGLDLRMAMRVIGIWVGAGLLAVVCVHQVARRWETARQRKDLATLIEAVAPTAAGACFLADAELAQEEVDRLLAAGRLQEATLRANGAVLARAVRPGGAPASLVVTQPLRSPFNPDSPVGELTLGLDAGAIDRPVGRTVQGFSLALLGLTLTAAGGLVVIARSTVQRPLAALAADVATLDPEQGARLGPARVGTGDALGQLGQKVNQLVDRLMAAMARGRLQEERLAGEARKLRAMLENTGKGIFVLRADGTLEAWTSAFLRLLGAEPPAPGSPVAPLFGPCSARVALCLAQCLEEAGPAVDVLSFPTTAAPGHRWLRITLDPIGPDWLQGLLEPVAVLDEGAGAQEALDPASGALNRLGAERAIGDALANQTALGLMLLSLDGAEAPPERLREAARRMAAALWPTDRVARLRGNDFLLVLGGLRDRGQAEAIGRRVMAALAPADPAGAGHGFQETAWVGIALLDPEEEPDRHALLERAGLALAEARRLRLPDRMVIA